MSKSEVSMSGVPARPDRGRRRQRPSRSGGGTGASLVWALLPIVTLGTGTWAVFLFAAIRRRSAGLAVAAAAYAGALVAAFVYGGNAPENSARNGDFGIVLILLALGGAAHAFGIRHGVFGYAPADSARPPRPGRTERRTDADAQRAAVDQWEQARKDRARARSICERDPQEALELFIGRPDLPDSVRTYADGGLVDVNNVPAWRLTTSLGIRRPVADQIVAARTQVSGFDSLDDLSVSVGLPPKLLDAVADRLVFLPLLPANHSTD